MSLVVRWQSALPVRQALVKARFGAEAGGSQEAAKMLSGEQNFYVIAITGLPGRMLQNMPPEKLKAAGSLRLTKTESIAAEDVRVVAGQQPLGDLFLVFSRTRAIRLEDKEVEFVFAGPLEVRKKFRLKDMVFDGKLEL